MASISKNKGNKKNKIMVSDEELNVLTIALALLNIQDMEKEAEEQGLSFEKLTYEHFELFNQFTKVTKLYPVNITSLKTTEDKGNEENATLPNM